MSQTEISKVISEFGSAPIVIWNDHTINYDDFAARVDDKRKSSCSADGDHISDLPMLEEVVGHPHIVSSDPAMVAFARARGGEMIDPDSPRLSPGQGHSPCVIC
ncbi:hypothetical protein [Bradyrhizobium sp. USDA 4502]